MIKKSTVIGRIIEILALIEDYFSENIASSKPMGLATYKTATDMPEELRRALPDIEELKK